jgi:hypothetical protein
MAYPVPPKDLNLLVGDDDPIEPVDCANQEDKNVAGCSKISAHTDHEQSEENL